MTKKNWENTPDCVAINCNYIHLFKINNKFSLNKHSLNTFHYLVIL